MSNDKEFEDIFSVPTPDQPVDITDDPEYQKFVESMVQYCHCAEHYRPCDGVLAGGLCDNIQDDEDDSSFDDFDDEEQAGNGGAS